MKKTTINQKMKLWGTICCLLFLKSAINAQANSFNDVNAAPGIAGGFSNTAIGVSVMSGMVGTGNTNGANNTAMGVRALDNIGLGTSAPSGNNNTAVGLYAARFTDDGNDNVAIGAVAMESNTDGGANVGVGVFALFNNVTGGNNTSIGRSSDVGASNLSNATAVGQGAVVNTSDRVWLGDANVANNDVWSYGTYNTVSDGRFKSNISENDVKGLEFIKLLRPVVYNFEAKKATEYITKNMSETSKKYLLDKDFSEATAKRQSGFIAQEVEDAAKKVSYNFNGVHSPKGDNDTYGVAYAQFVVPLVKAVQEQQKMIEGLQQQVADLTASQTGADANKTGINQFSSPGSGFSMDQNIPNPFTNETVIKYTLPQQINTAYVAIYDLTGKQITRLALTEKGSSSITFTSEKLAAGIYIYSIVADGKIMDSKRMVVAEK